MARFTRGDGIYLRGRSWYYDFWLRGVRYGPKSIGVVSRIEAKAYVENLKTDLRRGLLNLSGTKVADPLFEVFLDDFLKRYAISGRKASTVQKMFVQTVVYRRYFEGRRMASIITQDIEAFKAHRFTTGRKPGTVLRDLVILNQLFGDAVARKQTLNNPVAEVELPRVKSRRARFLTDDEESRLLQACSPYIRPVVIVAIDTGLRQGELLKLEWRDVDFTRNVLAVRAENATDPCIKI